MKSLHIRNVEPQTIERLKRLARSHNRSLQGELRDILNRAARVPLEDYAEESLDLVTVNTETQSRWTREEIYGDQPR
jgi:plasmid stability protein